MALARAGGSVRCELLTRKFPMSLRPYHSFHASDRSTTSRLNASPAPAPFSCTAPTPRSNRRQQATKVRQPNPCVQQAWLTVLLTMQKSAGSLKGAGRAAILTVMPEYRLSASRARNTSLHARSTARRPAASPSRQTTMVPLSPSECRSCFMCSCVSAVPILPTAFRICRRNHTSKSAPQPHGPTPLHPLRPPAHSPPPRAVR